AEELLRREIKKAKGLIEGEKKVRKILEASADKKILVLPEELPWGRVLRDKPEVMFVVCHRNDGRWGAKVVQDEGFKSRKPFPASWGGKTGEELQKLTGISDSVFCHRALFLALAESKEGAIKLAEKALNA
ncbi:MAG: MYG1 family protein, partial [Parcubacteria group bacterium]